MSIVETRVVREAKCPQRRWFLTVEAVEWPGLEPTSRRRIEREVKTHLKRSPMRTALMLAGFAMVLAGCQREEREFRLDPPVAAALDKIALMPNGIAGAPPEVYFALD